MEEFFDAGELAVYLGHKGYLRIGIDGIDGVGKTTLANVLSQQLGYPAIHLDSNLEKNQGGFIDHLDYAGLKSAMEQNERLIVEGVCLMEVLQRVGVAVDALVYVMRQSHGLWADERELNIEGDVEEFIQGEIELVRRFLQIEGADGEVKDLGLSEEIIRYHAAFKPHENANAIYWRKSC